MTPEERADAFQQWSLRSRIRYGIVRGVGAAILFVVLSSITGPLSLKGSLKLAALAFVIAGLSSAFIWYPLAKKRAARRSITTGI